MNQRIARILPPVPSLVGIALMLLGTNAAHADSTDAACVIYPAESDTAQATLPCHFYQAQGHVVITRSDGIEHDLAPDDSAPGRYKDAAGRTVYRQSGLGSDGLIFRLPDESVYVYWSTAMLTSGDSDNPTAPYSTADYDATALFRCKGADAPLFAQCPGGILRMDDGQASIVVRGPDGQEFTINFLNNGINATRGDVGATLSGDTWTLKFDNGEEWEIPLAAIEGG